jgi:hypothetical protein
MVPMARCPAQAALAALAFLAACGEGAPDAGLRVAVDTVGDTVTVRTLAGSVWDSARVLVEDLSIGVEEGAPEEMFGQIRALAVAPDGAIYVMDPEPALRKFDRDGRYVATFGRLGSGPGEYRQPDGGLTVLADGRVVVRDPSNGRFQLFTPTGEHAGTWPATTGFNTSRRLARDTAGQVYTLVLLETDVDVRDWKMGLRRLDTTGATHDTLRVPEWEFERMQITGQREGNSSINDVPFSPRAHWDWSPLGYFVGGVSDRYRIDLLRPEGVLRLERETPPVPVDPGEAADRKAEATENMVRSFPGWTWNGPDVPATKPVFRGLFTGADGRIWVLRSQPGRKGADGDWIEAVLFDVFEPDGRYLGEAKGPEGFRTWPEPHFRGDTAWAAVESEDGVMRVKRLVAR